MSVTMEHVVDVTDADFEQIVIEGSKIRPVVLDLWATWCGPCRTLSPILEKVAQERQGAFLLAKLDVDPDPRLGRSRRLGDARVRQAAGGARYVARGSRRDAGVDARRPRIGARRDGDGVLRAGRRRPAGGRVPAQAGERPLLTETPQTAA